MGEQHLQALCVEDLSRHLHGTRSGEARGVCPVLRVALRVCGRGDMGGRVGRSTDIAR